MTILIFKFNFCNMEGQEEVFDLCVCVSERLSVVPYAGYNALQTAFFTQNYSGHLLFCLLSICSQLLLAKESLSCKKPFHGIWVGPTLSQDTVVK